VWPSIDAVSAQWTLDAEFEPADDRSMADAAHERWLRALERSRGWES